MSNNSEKLPNQAKAEKSEQNAQQVNQNNERKTTVESPHTVKTKSEIDDCRVNLQASKEFQSEDITEKLAKLEDQLRLCIKSQQFVEAEELKNKVKEMRLTVVIKKNKEIEKRHAEEMEQLNQAQSAEMQTFFDFWDKKVTEYKQEAETAEKDMIKKHQTDLSILEEDLRVSLPLLVRTSARITNIRKTIETLAKQNEFVQADQMRAEVVLLEEEEVQKAEEQKEKKISFILMQLINKQKNELAGLKKRVSTGYLELMKVRDSEYQKLGFKLQNLRKSLETAHQQELSKFEMTYKNYIPGEKLQFKTRKRCGSTTRDRIPPSLNCSFGDAGGYRTPTPILNAKKRSMTPVKEFHIRGYQSSNSTSKKGNNTLIPINPVRFIPNQNERKD